MGSGASKESTVDHTPSIAAHIPPPTQPPPPTLEEKNGVVPSGGMPPQQGMPQAPAPAPPPPKPVKQQPPPARPPEKRKAEVFSKADYTHIDDYVFQTPQTASYGTFRQLVAYLTADPSWDDMAKVRAIFRWVTSVDVFSLNLKTRPPKQSPMEYFIKIKESTGNHAHLFNAFCKMAGIPCEIITGMNKSAAYQMGKPVDRKAMGAQWNAVFVAGDWRFVDAFWASSCVVGKKTGEWALMDAEVTDEDDDEEVTEGTTQHRINEFYFLPNPEELIWTHFPDKTEWQLLETPFTVEDYQEHFYVRERFHIFGMSETPMSKRQCILSTTDGEVEIEFALPPDRSSNFHFKHMLYRSRTTVSEDSAIDTVLDRFVLFEHYQNLVRFALRFPLKGTFKLDIYGLDVNESDIFDLCCSYIIECPQAKTNCLPLPDCPSLGWGPVQKTTEAGLTPVTHVNAKVVANNGYVEIRLDKQKALVLHQQLKHAVLDDSTLSKYCLTRMEDGEIIMYLRLPQKGEYALKLFAQEPEAEGEADNVLNYLVQCQGQTDESLPFPNTSHGTLGKGPDAKRFKVKPLSHDGGTIDTFEGKVSVKFKAKKNAELVCEVHTVDKMADKHVTVTRHHGEDGWTFDLDLPVSGEYSLNVFAKGKDSSRELYSVHSYLVQSDGHGGVQDENANTDEMGRENIIQNETVETSMKEAFIPIPEDSKNAMGEFHRRTGQHTADSQPLELIDTEDMSMFRVFLEDFAEYVMNVYSESEPDSGRVFNIAKYQVNRRRPGELYSGNITAIMDTLQEEEPEDNAEMADGDDGNDIDDSIEKIASPEHRERQAQAKKAVQQAMDLKDQKHLEQAIARYMDTEVPEDDPMLVRAQKLLAALQAKTVLMEASQKRQIQALEDALQLARKVNFEHQLDMQIATAARLKEHLVRLEKLRHAVLHMDQKTVAELKTYVKPPAGVHESMMATFLLLGSTLKEVKQWKVCQNLMSKTGKLSMMRKISQFDPCKVPMKAANQAKRVSKAFTTDQIRDASAGAATFYIWAQGMIEEVESYGGAEGADQLRLQK